MALYTKSELAKQLKADLAELAQGHGLDFDTSNSKVEIMAALLEIEEERDEELEDELEDELEEELEDEDEPELDDEEPELDDEEEDDIEPAPTKKAAAKKPAAKKEVNPDALAAKQVATLLGTEAKVLRQFLRSDASTFEAVGSGGRYEFTSNDVPKIKEEFVAWKAAHASRGSKRSAKGSTPAVEVEDIEEVEEIEEFEEEELEVELDDEEDDLELED